jgi:hypothetical protein
VKSLILVLISFLSLRRNVTPDFLFLNDDLLYVLVVLVAGFPFLRPGVEPRSGHVGFVVDKVVVGYVFSEYFGFLCQL